MQKCGDVLFPWNMLFPSTTLSSLTRYMSDHVPLIIHINTSTQRSRQFRLKSAWTQSPAYLQIVQRCWAPNRWAAASLGCTHPLAQALQCTHRNFTQRLKFLGEENTKKILLRPPNAFGKILSPLSTSKAWTFTITHIKPLFSRTTSPRSLAPHHLHIGILASDASTLLLCPNCKTLMPPLARMK